MDCQSPDRLFVESQMRSHRPSLQLAGAPWRLSRVKAPPPPVNPDAPTLNREGYFTLPPLKRLQRMTDEELAAVDRFVVRGAQACKHSGVGHMQKQETAMVAVSCNKCHPHSDNWIELQRSCPMEPFMCGSQRRMQLNCLKAGDVCAMSACLRPTDH